jgi:hypothetical protein
MKNILKKNSRLIFVGVILLPLLCIMNVSPAHSKYPTRPGKMKYFFENIGVKAEMVRLQSADGFSQAIVIEGPKKVPVIVGIEQDKMGKSESLFLSLDGIERAVVIETEDAIEELQCIFDVIIYNLTEISLCEDDPVCITTGILSMMIDIIDCAGEDDGDIDTVRCVFNSAVNGLTEISLCEDDPVCSTEGIFAMVIDIIECAEDDVDEIEPVRCIFDAIIVSLTETLLCEDDPVCALSSVFSMIIDIIVCAETDSFSNIRLAQ